MFSLIEGLLDSIMKRFATTMETAQIRQLVNGPESFSADGNWNVGEVPEVGYNICTNVCHLPKRLDLNLMGKDQLHQLQIDRRSCLSSS